MESDQALYSGLNQGMLEQKHGKAVVNRARNNDGQASGGL